MLRANARRASEAIEPTSTMDAPTASKLNHLHHHHQQQQQLRRPLPGSSRLSSLPLKPPRRCCSGGRGCVLLLSASALLSVLLYLQLLPRSSGSCKFSIVIDGGSTGTRIHVFAYRMRPRAMVPLLDFGLMASTKVVPGLSYYSGEPEMAGDSLVELLHFAKERVPRDLWGKTEIRLMATAGLRLLDAVVAERILESCRKLLRSSELRFQDDWATVISGSDEGIYAWVAANYALDTLGGDPNKTIGVFELGGASAQITFVSNEPLPPEFTRIINFGTMTYILYSYSFLHLGQNVAHESLHELLRSRWLKSSVEPLQEATYGDPCTPKGYMHNGKSLKLLTSTSNPKVYSSFPYAIGNFSECRKATLMLLEKGKDDKCLFEKCHLGSAYVPKLQGRLLATENFFYTSKFFGLGTASCLSDIILAGERFCNDEWANLKKMYHTVEEEDLLPYCFSSAYIIALLHDSLGIDVNDNRIIFTNQVGNVPVDWALGAFIMQKASNLDEDSSSWIFSTFSYNSSTSFFAVVFSLVVLAIWFVSKYGKPQLRTIYDLEKGRYILKRVNR